MKKNKLKESETLELKKSTSELKEGIISVVAILNKHQKGKLYFGVKNNGDVFGQEITENTLRKISKTISDNIEPRIYPKIEKKIIDDKDCILVSFSGQNLPYFAYNRAYKRVADEDKKISQKELEKMFVQKNKLSWDKEVCKEASLDDIDWNFVNEEFIPLYEKITGKETVGKAKDILISLDCIIKNKPTKAGILLFGKKPLKYFINSYIALARYKGKEVGGERLDYKEFEGNIFNQIDKCNEYIKEHTAMMSRLKPGNVRRQDIPEYGLFSVRELITNAVCHRKYENQHSKIIIKMFDNKIEFYNPGGLPEGITPRNIAKEQNSRNPIIAKVLAKVEYIEEVGEGWDKIIKEHKEHLLKPDMPKIESSEHSVTVTLFSTKEKFGEEKKEIILNERQKKIIKFLEENRMIITRKCAELLNVSEDTALRELSQLNRLNLIERKGIGRGVYYVIK